MKLYRIETDNGASVPEQHFASLSAARKAAREALREGDAQSVDVELVELVPLTRENVATILNTYGGHYAVSATVVDTLTNP